MSTSTEERKAREKAHALLRGVCYDIDGRAIIGHARVCDAVADYLLASDRELVRLRDALRLLREPCGQCESHGDGDCPAEELHAIADEALSGPEAS